MSDRTFPTVKPFNPLAPSPAHDVFGDRSWEQELLEMTVAARLGAGPTHLEGLSAAALSGYNADMNERCRPRPLPRGFFASLARGASYVLEALRFMNRERLWRLASAAVAVNVLLLVALVAGCLAVALPRLHRLSAWLLGLASETGLAHGLLAIISCVAYVLGIALVVGFSALTLALVGQAVAGPFLDLLSERVEELVLGQTPYPFSVSRLFAGVRLGIENVVAGLVLLAMVNSAVFVLGLVPVIGTVPAAVSSFCFSALLLAHEFVGMSLARHLVGYRDRWAAIRRNKLISLGFGSAAMVLVMVPGLNLVLLPLATVGGTLLYCDLKAAGRISTGGNGRAGTGG